MRRGSIGAVARDVAVYGSGDLLLRVAALVTVPVYTRVFEPAEYGVLSFVWMTQVLLGAVLALGGDSAYARYFFEAKTHRERQVITSTLLAFLLVWSVAVVAVFLPFAGPLSRWAFDSHEYGDVLALALVLAPLMLMNTMLAQALRNEFRAKLVAALNVATALLGTALGLFAVFFLDWGLVGVVAGMVAGSALLLPARAWAARSLLAARFSMRVLRPLLKFGVGLVPAALAWWVVDLSDRLVLARLSTADELGFYSVAITLASALALVNAALGQAWTPHSVAVYEEQRVEAPAFFGRVMTYILVCFGALSVTLTAFSHEVVLLLSGARFAPAAAAVGPLALAILAYASLQVTASGISLMKKTHYLAAWAWVAALLNLGLNIALVPRWGMLASAWATLASYVVLTIGCLATSQRLWAVAYERTKSLTAIALTLVFTVLVPVLPMPEALIERLAVKLGYCLLYLALLVRLRVIDEREIVEIRALIDRRRLTRVRQAT